MYRSILYVHQDQAGFIPGRQGPDQIRRAIDIISLLNSQWDSGPHQEGFLLSIDLQKAFDTVTWPYLFNVLERWGFCPNFLEILHSLYCSPSAQVRIQGSYSDPLNIKKGTRQGCSLFCPIEFLARTHPDIKEVRCGPQGHKYTLFADDLLLFVTSPLISIPNIFSLLKKIVNASGLQVNVSKSLALNIIIPSNLLKNDHFPLTWCSPSIPYLGVNLTSTIDSLYSFNYPPIFHKLSSDFV